MFFLMCATFKRLKCPSNWSNLHAVGSSNYIKLTQKNAKNAKTNKIKRANDLILIASNIQWRSKVFEGPCAELGWWASWTSFRFLGTINIHHCWNVKSVEYFLLFSNSCCHLYVMNMSFSNIMKIKQNNSWHFGGLRCTFLTTCLLRHSLISDT